MVLRPANPAPPISLNYHWLLSVVDMSISTTDRHDSLVITATTGHVQPTHLSVPTIYISTIPSFILQMPAPATTVSPSVASTQVVGNDKKAP